MESKLAIEYDNLLNPELLNSISGLELLAKIVVDGYLSGKNKSARLGSGMEFSQYRSYQPGDDIRLLDWKVLARSGRYYIKESDIETNISVKFILDSSASMLHEEGGIFKLGYARILIAAIAMLAKHQGDIISLYGLNDQNLSRLDPKLDKQHFQRFLKHLLSINGEGRWPDNPEFTEKIHNRKHKELIVFISDMYEWNSELLDFLHRLKTIRNEVIVLQVMGQDEISLNYDGMVTFEDLESGERVKVEAKAIRKSYQDSFQHHINDIKRQLERKNIMYEQVVINQPPAYCLEVFLKKRNRLR